MKVAPLIAASLLHASFAIADGAAAQCSPLTSYIPVTYTVTSYVTPTVTVTETASAPAVQPETASVSPTSTLTRTSTSTYYSTITMSASPEVTTSGLFSYIVTSGTTSWFGSIAPSSGESLVYVTTTIYVQPSVTSTLDTVTVSPPPYLTTTYSVPDADITSTLTTTRTSTTTLSSVVTQLRSSFTPIGSLGWNSSSTDSVGPTGVSSISGSGAPITVTGTIYWSTGIPTTSTSFSTLTTTLTQSLQSTLTGTSTGITTISLETVSVTGSSDSSASSSLGTVTSNTTSGSSTAASPSSQPTLSPSAFGSTSLSTSGYIPSTLPILPTYGGYGGLSTSVVVSSTSPASSLVSSVAVSSSSGSSGQSSTISASPVTQSSSSLAESSVLPLSSSSSPIVSVTSLISSRSPSSTASSIVSSAAAVSSGAISMTSTSLSTSSLASLGSFSGLSSTRLTSSGAQSGSTSLSTSVTPSSGSGSTEALSTVVSSTPATSSSASGGQSSSSALASSSSTIPIIPTISGPQTYSIPSSLRPVETSSTTVGSLPGGYGIPSSLSGGSSVSTGSVSASSLPSTVPTSTAATPSPSVSSTATSGSLTSGSPTSAVSTTVSSTVSSASATPSACGEYGNFTLNFDDLPNFSGSNDTDITQAPPIFNGYHHFAFSDGYVYAPPPNDPFPPRSAPHLAVFLGNASSSGVNNTSSALGPTSGLIRPGEFGDGSSAAQSAFWFNVYNAWLGCDNSGPEACTYVLTAYVFDASAQAERPVDTVNATTPPCPGFQDCQLQQVNFPSTFQGLSGVQIQAYKGQDQVMFFMDDVSMGWYNNTCAAGLQRLRSPRGAAVARR